MVDPRRVRQLLDRISEEVGHLRRLANVDEDELLADHDRLHAAKYGLVVAVEAALDAGRHVIASESLRAPDTFAEVFRILRDADYLTAENAAAMETAARFQNLLVHQYAEVDDLRVVGVLRSCLDDLDDFRQQMAGALTEA